MAPVTSPTPSTGSPTAVDAAMFEAPAAEQQEDSADSTAEPSATSAPTEEAQQAKRQKSGANPGPSEAGTPPAATAEPQAEAPADAAGPSAAAADGAGTSAGADAAAVADSLASGTLGLATNLIAADCTPGTDEFDAAKAKNDNTLQAYQNTMQQNAERAKPDMIAYKLLREQYTPADPIYGHIPGVKVADEFSGRGELAILGLHTSMMRGIMARVGSPAYAICLAGGYKDDTDEGNTFWYTGQGGQEKGKQVKDQSFESIDNAALVKNVETQTPVRVFRGKAVGNNGRFERKYVYEGLYRVTEYKLEVSQDGPMVCKFKMEAVPGHSTVSGTVTYKSLNRNPFAVRSLAGADRQTGKKSRRAIELRIKSRAELEKLIEQRAAAGEYGRLVNADLSAGKEEVPIPVWNSVDDDDAILLPTDYDENPQFTYITDYKFGETAAKELAVQAEQQFIQDCTITCGLEYGGAATIKGYTNYTNDGLLMCTYPCGIMECDHDCKKYRACKRNRIASMGLRYPLEIYKVSAAKRWGVRCSEDLPIGAVICRYIGLVITDESAEELRNQDTYLFDLDHFQLLHEADNSTIEMNKHMPALPQEFKDKHLVVDACKHGNIGRFLNHSCAPNCVVQTVFAGCARSQLLYYVIIVAGTDIPKYTELTYDYGYSIDRIDSQRLGRIACTCGAPDCRGKLL